MERGSVCLLKPRRSEDDRDPALARPIEGWDDLIEDAEVDHAIHETIGDHLFEPLAGVHAGDDLKIIA